jgi:hypothetical protein
MGQCSAEDCLGNGMAGLGRDDKPGAESVTAYGLTDVHTCPSMSYKQVAIHGEQSLLVFMVD